MSSPRWNVAVLGGGPAGCATALALERKGIPDVCIIEPDGSAGPHIGETLPPETRLLLDELGLWAEFVGEGHEESLGSCSSWGSDALGFNDFLLNPYGRGWHLDRPRFDTFLRRRAASRNIAVVSGARFVRYDSDRDGDFELHLRHGGAPTIVHARYVVDATGIQSAFARRAGARPLSFDRLSFVYGFFEADADASPTRLTMLEATKEGWWYAAGLPDRRVAVAFATDPETVREQELSVEGRWFARLLRTRHVAPRLDGCRLIRGSAVVRVAPSFLLDRVAGARWLAVGDAASGYDPLSSMGIHKALADGVEAAGALAEALESSADIAPAYASSVAANFEEYRINRNYLYQLETRWAESPFWRNRRERTGAGASTADTSTAAF